MQDFLIITLFIAFVALISMLMSRFYLGVTKDLKQDSLFTKVRNLSFLLPVLTLIGTIAFIISIPYFSNAVTRSFVEFTKGVLLTQLFMIAAIFFSKEARQNAFATTEAKIVRLLMKAAAFLAVLAGKIAIGVLRASARSRKYDDYDISADAGLRGHHRNLGWTDQGRLRSGMKKQSPY